MSEITDAQRLRGKGSQVQLADGATHEIRFSNRSLAQIEDDYDGLEAFAQVLQRKPFKTMAYVISLTLGVPSDQAIDLVDSRRVKEYIDATGAALEAALPAELVPVRIIQNHEVEGDRYRAGTVVEVSSGRARHLVEARVAELVEGNVKAAPGNESPGAAFSASPSPAGTSTRSGSGT